MLKKHKLKWYCKTIGISMITLLSLSLFIPVIKAVDTPLNDNSQPKGTKIGVDHGELMAQVQAAKDVGIKVTSSDTKKLVVSDAQLQAKMGESRDNYQKQFDNLSKIIALQKKNNEQYQADKKSWDIEQDNYKKAYADYIDKKGAIQKRNADKKAAYDKLVDQREAEIKKATDKGDQHLSGTYDLNNYYGGYLNGKVSYDYTYHWEMKKDTFVISKVSLQFQKQAPDHKGAGFWDTVYVQGPKFAIPEDSAKGNIKGGADLKEDGNSLWNQVKDTKYGVMFYLSQHNKTGEMISHQDTDAGIPYEAVQLENGDFEVARFISRNLQRNSEGEYANWIVGNRIIAHSDIPVEPKKPDYEPEPKQPVKPTTLEPKLKVETANYQLIAFYVSPTVTKSVTLGQTTGDQGQSITGKKVLKGQQLTYTLKATDLPANRTDDEKNISWEDVLPVGVTYQKVVAYTADGQKDVSSLLNFSYDVKTRKLKANVTDEYLKIINDHKDQVHQLPVLNIYVIVNQDNVTLSNDYDFFLAQSSFKSNQVTNTVPKITPHKMTLDDDGQNINNQDVKVGQIMNYRLIWDLVGLKDVEISDEMSKKGFGLSDNYDVSRLTITAKTKTDFTMIDQTTKRSIASEVTVNWDEKLGKFEIEPNDVKDFLTKHAGHQIDVEFHPVVKTDGSGELLNQAVQNNFGQTYKTETVKNQVTKVPMKSLPNTGRTNTFDKIWQAIENIK